MIYLDSTAPAKLVRDAVHVATADQLVAAGKTVAAFVTYDTRLAESARRGGLTVVAPG